MRGRVAATIVAIGCVTLTACGSSSGSNADGTAPGTLPTAAVSPTTLPAATLPTTTPPDPNAPTTTSTTTSTTSSTPPPTPTPSTVGPTSSTPPTPEQVAFTPLGEISNPVDLVHRNGDDAFFFFVVSQDGFIVAMRDGVIDDTRLLDVSDEITSGGEQGLLGLAFSADGTHAYIDATNRKGDTEITEYAVGADGVFDPSSKRLLLTIDQPYPNHNGGQVRIGPDGLLYIGMGDGGDGGDPHRNGLDTSTLLGKLLRIDPAPAGDQPYSVPADNPFAGTDDARPEIWSVGLRNPWRFSFDLATNDLWIADVGQGDWEEIDVAWADEGGGRGLNFGWSAFEGTHRFNDDQPAGGAVAPIHEYEHGPAGCSVSGGVRYRGTAIPGLYGWYVYGDYCSGQVRALQVLDDRSAGQEVTLTDALAGISEVAQGPDGELYVLSVELDEVLALRPAG